MGIKLAKIVGGVDKPKMNKEERFVVLAQKRVGRAMIAIRLVGNLASPNYKYTSEQTDKIVSALQAELDAVYSGFTSIKGVEKVTFTL